MQAEPTRAAPTRRGRVGAAGTIIRSSEPAVASAHPHDGPQKRSRNQAPIPPRSPASGGAPSAGPESGHAAIAAVRRGGRYADWIRAFRETPHQPRSLRFGEEDAWARRKGKAGGRRPGLPVLAI